MSATYRVEAEPAASALDLPRVDAVEVALARIISESRFPKGIGRQIADSANGVVDQLLAPESRPRVVLEGGRSSIELAPADLEAASDDGAFVLARGRSAAHLVRTGAKRVTRNGWLVGRSQPVRLRDGDTVSTVVDRFVVVYDPPQHRPSIEIGRAGVRPPPTRPAFELPLMVVPAGVPIVVACDAASGRSVVDLVLGRDGLRPFDPTVTGEIERGVLEWTIHRAAHNAVRGLLGLEASISRVDEAPCGVDAWIAAAVRVGAHHGSWWLGTSAGALGQLAASLSGRVRRAEIARSSAPFEITVVARAMLGRLAAGDLATLSIGDTLVAREARFGAGGAVEVRGEVSVAGARSASAPALLHIAHGRVEARIGGTPLGERSTSMAGDEIADETIRDSPFDAALDEIAVSISFEAGRARLTLAELLDLGPGSIVVTGAPVRNAVIVLVDGSPFARGELVDAEGSLAVRILSVGGGR